jgi:hypothetical protein
MVRFFKGHELGSTPEPSLAAPIPQMPASPGAEAGAFTLAAAAAVSFEARASPPVECAWEKRTAKDEVRFNLLSFSCGCLHQQKLLTAIE